MAIFIFLIIIVLIIMGVRVSIKKTKEDNEKFKNKLLSTNFVISKNMSGILFVDDINKKWILRTNQKISPKIYDYSDLIEYEVYQDGESISKGRAGSAVVGGLLFGVVGAIIGSSGSKKNKNICNTLQLRVRVNNLEEPERIISFINTQIKKDSIVYKTNFESVKNMAATLAYIQNQRVSVE